MGSPETTAFEAALERLAAEHPGWLISSMWVSVGSGPDARMLTAQRGGVLLGERTPADLSAKIKGHERPD